MIVDFELTAFEMTQNSGQTLRLVETTMDYLLRKHKIMNQRSEPLAYDQMCIR